MESDQSPSSTSFNTNLLRGLNNFNMNYTKINPLSHSAADAKEEALTTIEFPQRNEERSIGKETHTFVPFEAIGKFQSF